MLERTEVMKIKLHVPLWIFHRSVHMLYITTSTMHQHVTVLSFGQFMQNIYVHVVVLSLPSLTFYFPVFENGSVWKQRAIDNFSINVILTFFPKKKYILSFWKSDLNHTRKKIYRLGKKKVFAKHYFILHSTRNGAQLAQWGEYSPYTNVSWVWFLHSVS